MQNKKLNETVTLILTHACNLNCVYCYEKFKSNKVMSFDEACKILNKHLNKKTEAGVNIELFGGEPFIVFPLIRQIVDYLESHTWERKYMIFIDTNGTLITDEIRNWLYAHRNVSYGLSLDGTPEAHNMNRSNSFDKINLELFKELNPNGIAKMTVSKASLPHLYDGIRFLHGKGLHFSANLAYGEPWDETDVPILERELRKMADFYIKNPQHEICSIIRFRLDAMVEDPEKLPEQIQYCGSGIQMHTYDVDGKEYGCQFFSPVTLGKRAITAEEMNQTIRRKYPSYLIEPACRSCPARTLCPTCIGSNYHSTGSIFRKDLSMCQLLKTQFKATAYLYYNLWKAGRIHCSEETEYAVLRGIELAQAL